MIAPAERPSAPPIHAEATEPHTRILRLTLGVEESRDYWERVEAPCVSTNRALEAFEQRWFGSKSLERVRLLLAGLSERFDAFPEALTVLHRWRGMDPGTRQAVCHFHVQLSDPIYRRFTGVFLVQRRGLQNARLDRGDLKLYGYSCADITEEDFVEVYPMLPGHVDLLMQITSNLRVRSRRMQGDDHAIRGLLQLLGELFRAQKLADGPVGSLVTLDAMFDVQHSALDADIQTTLSRIFNDVQVRDDELAQRVAKAVSLLELVQEQIPTTAELVAQCLYSRLGEGNRVPAVTEALENCDKRAWSRTPRRTATRSKVPPARSGCVNEKSSVLRRKRSARSSNRQSRAWSA